MKEKSLLGDDVLDEEKVFRLWKTSLMKKKSLLRENFPDERKIFACRKIIGLVLLKMKPYNNKNTSVNLEKNLTYLLFSSRHHPFSM